MSSVTKDFKNLSPFFAFERATQLLRVCKQIKIWKNNAVCMKNHLRRGDLNGLTTFCSCRSSSRCGWHLFGVVDTQGERWGWQLWLLVDSGEILFATPLESSDRTMHVLGTTKLQIRRKKNIMTIDNYQWQKLQQLDTKCSKTHNTKKDLILIVLIYTCSAHFHWHYWWEMSGSE